MSLPLVHIPTSGELTMDEIDWTEVHWNWHDDNGNPTPAILR